MRLVDFISDHFQRVSPWQNSSHSRAACSAVISAVTTGGTGRFSASRRTAGIGGNCRAPSNSRVIHWGPCSFSSPAIIEVTFLSDNRKDLASVAARTLVLQCRDDAIAPVEVGEHVRDSITGSEMVLLEATGHCPNLSAPDQVIAAIRAFV